jgi:hypothetical protein
MVMDPFFCLKIGRLKATVRRLPNTSIDVKTGSLDPADFAMNRHLLPRIWHTVLGNVRWHVAL